MEKKLRKIKNVETRVINDSDKSMLLRFFTKLSSVNYDVQDEDDIIDYFVNLKNGIISGLRTDIYMNTEESLTIFNVSFVEYIVSEDKLESDYRLLSYLLRFQNNDLTIIDESEGLSFFHSTK